MREGEGGLGGRGYGWMREESANGNLQKSDRARKVARRDFRVRAPKKTCVFVHFYIVLPKESGGERGGR